MKETEAWAEALAAAERAEAWTSKAQVETLTADMAEVRAKELAAEAIGFEDLVGIAEAKAEVVEIARAQSLAAEAWTAAAQAWKEAALARARADKLSSK